jgi:nitroreductase
MDIIKEIKNRVSIRKFKNQKIDRSVLDRILEAGRSAPSAKNRQPWRFIVIDDEPLKQKIEKAAYGQDYVGNAGAIIAACSTNIEYEMPNGQNSYPIDISFAVSFMMMQTEHEGLGSCVVTTYDEKEIKSILTVPYSMRVVMLLLVGVPEDRYSESVRKNLNQVSAYNHW